MQEPSQLETAMALLMGVFHYYAQKDGCKDLLRKAELKILIEKEHPFFLQVGPHPRPDLHPGA